MPFSAAPREPLATNRRYLAITFACALAAGLYALGPQPVGVFYDDAMYVLLAKALATGQGYKYLNLPGTPMATHYPPGYPALLAVLWRLAPNFPRNLLLFKLANVLFTAVAALVLFVFARRRLEFPPSVAALGTIAGSVTLPTLYLTSMVLSEPLFLCLLVSTLLAAERLLDREHSLTHAAAVGAAIGLLGLVRSLGVFVAPAIVVILIKRRRWRECIGLTAAFLIVSAPWFWWVHHFDPRIPLVLRGAYGSYSGWLTEAVRAGGGTFVAKTVALNATMISGIIARTFNPVPNATLDALVVLLVAAFTAFGVIASWRRAPATLLFLGSYFAVILVWPFAPIRFVANLWALLMLFTLGGALTAWRHAATFSRARALQTSVAICGCVIALGLATLTVLGYRDRAWSGLARFQASRIEPKLAWAQRATKPADVIATEDEVSIYLYAGRQAVPVYSSTGLQHVVPPTPMERAAALRTIARLYGPSFVVVGTDEGLLAVRALGSDATPLFKWRYDIPASRVFVRAVRDEGN